VPEGTRWTILLSTHAGRARTTLSDGFDLAGDEGLVLLAEVV
jgi:hypothetical protein